MLLHRGHGSILSGFFGGVLSCGCDTLVSLCAPLLLLEDFTREVSFSAEGVLGFSKRPEDVGDFRSSVV